MLCLPNWAVPDQGGHVARICLTPPNAGRTVLVKALRKKTTAHRLPPTLTTYRPLDSDSRQPAA